MLERRLQRVVFGCVGNDEDAGGHLHSGEVGYVTWQGRWSVLVEEEICQFEWFSLAAPQEVIGPAMLEPAMVTPMGITTMLEASSRSLCVRIYRGFYFGWKS
jgi:hypothetical protein